jgi:hypothetical protein
LSMRDWTKELELRLASRAATIDPNVTLKAE